MRAMSVTSNVSGLRFNDRKQVSLISFQIPLDHQRRGMRIGLHVTDVNGSANAIANAAAPVIAELYEPWLKETNAGPIPKSIYADFLARLQKKIGELGHMRFCQHMGYLN